MPINDTDPSERGLTHIDVSSRGVPSCNVCRPPQSRGSFFPEEEEGARLGSVGLRHCLPHGGHGVGMWFRHLVAKRLKEEGIASDGDLVDFCNAWGGSWWMSMAQIGVGRARHVAFVVAPA